MTNDELNRLMAERVMGFHHESEYSALWYIPNGGYAGDFTPATDANDALRVIKKMQAKGWLYNICPDMVEFYHFSLSGNQYVHSSPVNCTDEICRAICEAAAKAVKGE